MAQSSANTNTNTSTAPGSLWDGDFNEAENRRAFQEARGQWIRGEDPSATTNSDPKTTETSTTSTDSTNIQPKKQVFQEREIMAREYVRVSDPTPVAGTGTGGGGGISTETSASSSLLEGDFDEKKAHEGFAEARRQWLAGSQSSATTVDTPPSNPGIPVISSSSEVKNNSGVTAQGPRTLGVSKEAQDLISKESSKKNQNNNNGGKLWWEGEFDEKESSKGFAEARKEWLNEATPAPAENTGNIYI